MKTSNGPDLVQLDALDPTRCPCGWARRAFGGRPGAVASVHLVDIEEDARTHYHRRTSEIYVVLEGEGEIELDGERHPVRPMTAVYIPSGCRHRAHGRLRILNIPVPPFDPADEHFD
jgi:mannose-6-phosphate isomerase-like protein (cupin superfamily)